MDRELLQVGLDFYGKSEIDKTAKIINNEKRFIFPSKESKLYVKQIEKLYAKKDKLPSGTQKSLVSLFLKDITRLLRNRASNPTKNTTVSKCKQILAQAEVDKHIPTISHYRDIEHGMRKTATKRNPSNELKKLLAMVLEQEVKYNGGVFVPYLSNSQVALIKNNKTLFRFRDGGKVVFLTAKGKKELLTSNPKQNAIVSKRTDANFEMLFIYKGKRFYYNSSDEYFKDAVKEAITAFKFETKNNEGEVYIVGYHTSGIGGSRYAKFNLETNTYSNIGQAAFDKVSAQMKNPSDELKAALEKEAEMLESKASTYKEVAANPNSVKFEQNGSPLLKARVAFMRKPTQANANKYLKFIDSYTNKGIYQIGAPFGYVDLLEDKKTVESGFPALAINPSANIKNAIADLKSIENHLRNTSIWTRQPEFITEKLERFERVYSSLLLDGEKRTLKQAIKESKSRNRTGVIDEIWYLYTSLERYKNAPSRRNSESKDIAKFNSTLKQHAKMFQGRINGAKRNVLSSDLQPKTTARIGYLASMKIKSPNGMKQITFDGESFLSMDRRKNLWVSGKDSRLLNIANGIKDNQMHFLGYLKQINYITNKKHIENGKVVEYYHKLGEVNNELPTVWLDSDGFIIINGGDYDVWTEGIVN